MKIGCPNCGQHYEIETGAIDRYFRCTECNTLFRGINAKPISVKKFRRRNKNRATEAAVAAALRTIEPETAAPQNAATPGEASADPAATPADPASAAGTEAAETVEIAEISEWAPDETAPLLRPQEGILNRDRLVVILGVLAALVLVILTGALVRLNGRLTELQGQNAACAAELTRQNEALLALQQQNGEFQNALQKQTEQLAALTETQTQLTAKVGSSDTASRLNQLDERLSALDPKAGGDTLSTRLDNCQNKLALLEKSFTESTAAQKNAVQQFNNELMRLVGAPRKNTTRTILERIDLLESLNMNNLSASGVPEKMPRFPIATRVDTLELLFSGNDDINLAQRYPGGFIAQLEALKSEVAKIKWALGK